jgi:hypothetical protein
MTKIKNYQMPSRNIIFFFDVLQTAIKNITQEKRERRLQKSAPRHTTTEAG